MRRSLGNKDLFQDRATRKSSDLIWRKVNVGFIIVGSASSDVI